METTIILRGGLGNQMFQYALAIALREKGHKVHIDSTLYNVTRMHNGYELGRVFGIQEKKSADGFIHTLWIRLLIHLHPVCLVSKDTLEYNSVLVETPKRYIDGYWQDERYFNLRADIIRRTFSFKSIDEKNRLLSAEMHGCNSVALHIRRGDYAAYGMSLITEEYYQKAVDYINDRVTNAHFYIFSDDADIAESMAKSMHIKYTSVVQNKGEDSYKDMFLMSQCKHNIIANSSFSWWGAWLNESISKIVVAPKVWEAKAKSLHPQAEGWILM